MSIPKYDRTFSYSDYVSWPEEEKIEIIDGVLYNMTPAPSTNHQRVSMNLSYQFMDFFKEGNCQVFAAPFDVRLFSQDKTDDEIFDVVQPDISVICDKNKLDDKGCAGSPDLIVEILSPSSAKMDKMKKRNLYEKACVKEYWIVDTLNELIEVYDLDENNQYGKPLFFSREDALKSILFEELAIDVGEIL